MLAMPLFVTAGQQKETARRAQPALNRNKTGLSLSQLRDQYRKDLFTDFLPFMDKYVIDHEPVAPH
jgi:hypothetical protein